MKKTYSIFLLPLIIIIVLTITHVVVANRLSTAGVELDNIQNKLTEYKKENILLKEKVLEQSSLDHIASAAADLGFVNSKSGVYFFDQLPLARR